MITELAIALAGVVVGAGIAMFGARRSHNAKLSLYLDQAKAKANAIEHEAEKLLQDARIKAKDIEIQAQKAYELKEQKLLSEYDKKFADLEQKQKDVNTLFKVN